MTNDETRMTNQARMTNDETRTQMSQMDGGLHRFRSTKSIRDIPGAPEATGNRQQATGNGQQATGNKPLA
jgi:hypothetical protein